MASKSIEQAQNLSADMMRKAAEIGERGMNATDGLGSEELALRALVAWRALVRDAANAGMEGIVDAVIENIPL